MFWEPVEAYQLAHKQKLLRQLSDVRVEEDTPGNGNQVLSNKRSKSQNDVIRHKILDDRTTMSNSLIETGNEEIPA